MNYLRPTGMAYAHLSSYWLNIIPQEPLEDWIDYSFEPT